ncbi:hypothetical protein E3E36_06080 [Thermococcus sp. M36]|uniref:hypothetical protein n=1 Tax=Thermococcus sp. M36 TaxID=1638261 RepID=UPI00143BC76B|nr:hypothetical protein [Thermococcus sp. M36]NJE05717.1 hypothetical protein [Thermococcus sp. M36]
MHWVLLMVNSVILVGIIYYINTSKYIVSLSGLLYGLLFYITNLYFVIPYEQTDIWPSATLEFMLFSGKITHEALATHSLSYLSYPISFIFETVLMLVGGIGKISIYTVGLFIFMGALYIGLIYYYSNLGKDIKFAVISLMTYIILSFYVINDQVAPQTFALIFLPYLYKVTFDFIEKGQKLKKFLILTIFWFALVFTHPFMFLFYILPVGGIVLYYQFFSHEKRLRTSTLGLLVSIWGLGFIWSFYNLLSIPLRVFIKRWGEVEGETWWIFARFFRKSATFGPIKYTPHPHYELIPRWIVETQAWVLRVLLILLLIMATYGFLSQLRKDFNTHTFPVQRVFDISILVFSGVLFIIGLLTTFLGQRTFQVAFIPFSKYAIKERARKVVVYTIMGIMMIAPTLFTINILINSTVDSPMNIRELHTLNTGAFLDYSIPDEHSYVFLGTNELFPIKGRKYTAITWIRVGKFSVSKFEFILWSKKVELTVEYYGVEELFSNEIKKRNAIYNDRFIRVYWR